MAMTFSPRNLPVFLHSNWFFRTSGMTPLEGATFSTVTFMFFILGLLYFLRVAEYA